jgi:subtilisin-like proprotein convertase family protein
VCVTILASASTLLAQPNELTLQGVLRTAGGEVVNGTYPMKFSFYENEQGGSAVATVSVPNVKVDSGIYTAALAFGPKEMGKDYQALWLGVTVENQAEYPRVKLASVLYALRARYANTAFALSCTGCIGEAMLGFVPITTVDGLGGGTIQGDVEVAGALTVGGAEVCTDDFNCGATLAQLSCEKEEMPVWDGQSWTCMGFAELFDPALLPADGLNEISNDLLTNQFVDKYASITVPVPIKDFYPPGVTDKLTVPDAGAAQKLTVSIQIANSDISKLKVVLFDPNGGQYVLFDKGQQGGELIATYPDPTLPVSGDLKSWVGKNPAGIWLLQAIDSSFNDKEFDGKITSWSIDVQTLSTKKVQVKGNLIVDGNITSAGGKGISINDSGNVTISGNLDVGGKITGDITQYTKAFGQVFTYWAHKTCPPDTTLLYDGVGFGSHYGHAGSPDSICMKGGDPGPSFGTEGDLLYPINTAGSGSIPPGVPANRSFTCAVCAWEKGQCFDMWGSNTCPNGWTAVYDGYGMGPYYTHASPGNRLCVDPEGFDQTYGTSDNGYLYGTRVQSGFYGGNWPSSRYLKCALCCRKP